MSNHQIIKRAISLAALAGLTLAGCASSGANTTDSAKEVEITFAATATMEDPTTKAVIAYLDAVGEATDGAVSYEVYMPGELVDIPELPNALDSGVVDIANIIPGASPEDFPADVWFTQLPSGPSDVGAPGRIFESMASSYEWWMTNEEVREGTFDSQGLYPLAPGITAAADNDLICTTPVASLADLEGLQVRSALPTVDYVLDAVGAIPVNMPAADAYEALQRGAIDCVAFPASFMAAADYQSIASDYIPVGLSGAPSACLCLGQNFWDSLSDDTRQIMLDKLPVYIEMQAEAGLNAYYEFNDIATQSGVTVHDRTPEVAAEVTKARDSLVDRAVANAPASVEDPNGLIDNFLEIEEDWRDFIRKQGYDEHETWTEWAENSSQDDIDVSPLVERLVERTENLRS